MMTPENPEKKGERILIYRTYQIFEDQIQWLDNSSLNKSKKIRELLDNFINERDATVIQNLKDEIGHLNEVIKIKDDKFVDRNRELMETIESQKSVIVALGGKE